jgi:hypothetical protein
MQHICLVFVGREGEHSYVLWFLKFLTEFIWSFLKGYSESAQNEVSLWNGDFLLLDLDDQE